MNSMGRLVLIEARKMTDTRSTRMIMLLMLVVGLCTAVLVMVISGSRSLDLDFSMIVTTLAFPAALGAPIIGILGMVGDWHHRDVMTFFALVSRRWRLFVAKVAGTLVVSLAIVLAVLTLSMVLSMVIAPTMELGWTAGELGNAIWLLLCATVLGSVCGAAISSAFLSAPLSMVFIILQTLLFDTLIGLIPGGIAPFLQSASLINHLTGDGPVAPALTSLVLWIVVPLCIGFWRNQRKEVS